MTGTFLQKAASAGSSAPLQTPTIPLETLTTDQNEAAGKLFSFLISDETFMNLTGPAGAGKSFLMRHLQDTILPEANTTRRLLQMKELRPKIQFSATTHRAVAQLTNAGLQGVCTVHAAMGFNLDSYTKQTVVPASVTPPGVKGAAWEHEVLVIDEASMIDMSLFKAIMETIPKKAKVIFVGDHCQLPPVGERISQIYLQNFRHVDLPGNVRAMGAPFLADVCAHMRSAVESALAGQLDLRSLPDGDGFTELQQAGALNHIKQHFKRPQTKHTILCFTNQRAQELSNYIRKPRGLPRNLVRGEILFLTEQYTERRLLAQGIPYTILRADPPKKAFITVTPKDTDKDAAPYKFSVWAQKCVLAAPNHEEIVAFVTQDRKTIQQHRGELQSPYDHGKHTVVAAMAAQEVMTVHKSQGMSLENVFVDVKDMAKCSDPLDYLRLLYVAVSRAKKHVFYFGNVSPYMQSLEHTNAVLPPAQETRNGH